MDTRNFGSCPAGSRPWQGPILSITIRRVGDGAPTGSPAAPRGAFRGTHP
jgi:hypothetical protein